MRIGIKQIDYLKNRMSMKRIIYLLLILNLGLLSCVDDASVRVMPEFNCKDTKVNLAKAAGSSVTSLLYTNVGQVVAQYQAEWLSVDVNAKSVIYTALTRMTVRCKEYCRETDLRFIYSGSNGYTGFQRTGSFFEGRTKCR